MSPEKTKLIEDTWRKVEPVADSAASLFYERLFQADPHVRSLFAGVDLAGQRAKLVQALAAVVGALRRLDDIVPVLEALGRRHAGYGVNEHHYEIVGDALLWTLEQGTGDAWTEGAKAAWSEAYALIAGTMQSAAVQMDKSGSRSGPPLSA